MSKMSKKRREIRRERERTIARSIEIADRLWRGDNGDGYECRSELARPNCRPRFKADAFQGVGVEFSTEKSRRRSRTGVHNQYRFDRVSYDTRSVSRSTRI
jgi:hypothetical protein